jgi:RNAse (barnase) inhibitor barstar
MLDREEYVEQAYFFRTLSERLDLNIPMQELLEALCEEVLATTKLPLAIDYLRSELIHSGAICTAMERLNHYFSPFQTYVVKEAENDRGRFDLRIGLSILLREAEYRSGQPSAPGVFFYQFETLCRNRLQYDDGLRAIAADPIFDGPWRDWILTVRRQIGIIDLADMIYVRSQFYLQRSRTRQNAENEHTTMLFGEKEGKIALANRRKDPIFLFAALQRHLGYPHVPRPKPAQMSMDLLPQVLRRIERLETRTKLLEEEQQSGIDITRFYSKPSSKPSTDTESNSG